MRRSTERIIVSHAGTLPRPPELQALFVAGAAEEEAFERELPGAIRDVVRRQAEVGIDVVNDGEYSKRGAFIGYVRERMTGFVQRPLRAGEPAEANAGVWGRDRLSFPGFHAAGLGGFNFGAISNQGLGPGAAAADPYFCVEPLTYVGHATVARDIAHLRDAVAGLDVEPYLPAVAPGTIEHWLRNDYYPDDETFLGAIAGVMHEEYRAITEAGIVLQIDDPDLPDGWQMFPEMSVAEYRRYAALRLEALNEALRDLPEELIRFHCCWGSQHGPHRADLPLSEFIDLVFSVRAECYSIEASNPRHEHEWRVFEEVRLPEGKSLMPGVVGHASDIIEHPETVAERLVRYADLVGRENVIAGTDCGIGSRVGHAEIAWAKLEELASGAALATERLFGR